MSISTTATTTSPSTKFVFRTNPNTFLDICNWIIENNIEVDYEQLDIKNTSSFLENYIITFSSLTVSQIAMKFNITIYNKEHCVLFILIFADQIELL